MKQQIADLKFFVVPAFLLLLSVAPSPLVALLVAPEITLDAAARPRVPITGGSLTNLGAN